MEKLLIENKDQNVHRFTSRGEFLKRETYMYIYIFIYIYIEREREREREKQRDITIFS